MKDDGDAYVGGGGGVEVQSERIPFSGSSAHTRRRQYLHKDNVSRALTKMERKKRRKVKKAAKDVCANCPSGLALRLIRNQMGNQIRICLGLTTAYPTAGCPSSSPSFALSPSCTRSNCVTCDKHSSIRDNLHRVLWSRLLCPGEDHRMSVYAFHTGDGDGFLISPGDC